MKKIITLLLLLSAFITNAQRTMFSGQNSYVRQIVPAVTTDDNPITNNLILYLDATSLISYIGSGTTWNDLSTQNNNATFTSAPTYSTSPGRFTFSSASYASTISTTINLTTATFIAWIKPSQTQTNYTGIIYLPISPTDPSYYRSGMQLRTNNSVGYTWGSNGASTYNWDSQLYAPNNQWSMIAISVSANSTIAYLCKEDGTITSATNIDTQAPIAGQKFYIGRDPILYSSSEADLRTFKGNISKALVYSSALSQSDITSIFNAQKGKYGIIN